MPHIRPTFDLTHDGALAMLVAARDRAAALAVPVNIVIVDRGGNDVALLRMDGALLLSLATARAKARTAASHRVPSGALDPALAAQAAAASGGQVTAMAGGLPIFVDGTCIGGIGVGSGSDDEDLAVAAAGLAAIGAASTPGETA